MAESVDECGWEATADSHLTATRTVGARRNTAADSSISNARMRSQSSLNVNSDTDMQSCSKSDLERNVFE